MTELLRLAAFTLEAPGGNTAGAWLGKAHPDDAEMRRIVAKVGSSETALLVPDSTPGGGVRIRTPARRLGVASCGHETFMAWSNPPARRTKM